MAKKSYKIMYLAQEVQPLQNAQSVCKDRTRRKDSSIYQNDQRKTLKNVCLNKYVRFSF